MAKQVHSYKRALVLTGGSIKGCYQAGAMKVVLEHFKPDIIFGVSVGALNGAYIVNETGKKDSQGQPVDPKEAGDRLVEFWRNNIQKPSDVAIPHSKVKLIWNILTKQWDGLVSIAPYKKLVMGVLSESDLKQSPIDYGAGYVNLDSGFYNERLKVGDTLQPQFIDHVIASGGVPVAYPPQILNNEFLVDGGVRHVAPVNDPNVQYDFEEMVVVSCHPADLNSENPTQLNPGDLLEQIDRVYNIVVNQNVNSDLRVRYLINQLINNGVYPDQWEDTEHHFLVPTKPLTLKVVKPEKPLQIQLNNFTSQTIEDLIQLGISDAKKVYGIS